MAPREDEEFFADPRYGEYWVGVRPTLEDLAVRLGIETRHLSELDAHVGKDAGATTVRLVRDADRELTQRLDGVRVQEGADQESLAEADDALVADRVDTRFVGTAGEVADRLAALRDATDADELLVTTITHDHDDRVRSFQLLAKEWSQR